MARSLIARRVAYFVKECTNDMIICRYCLASTHKCACVPVVRACQPKNKRKDALHQFPFYKRICLPIQVKLLLKVASSMIHLPKTTIMSEKCCSHTYLQMRQETLIVWKQFSRSHQSPNPWPIPTMTSMSLNGVVVHFVIIWVCLSAQNINWNLCIVRNF